MSTLTTTPARIRQPKGQPIGGQFAAETHAESTVSLKAPEPQAISDSAIVEQAKSSAGYYARRYNFSRFDEEDIAQDAIASVLLTRKNKGITVQKGLVHSAARALAQRLVDGHRRHEDSTALTLWKKLIEDDEHRLGRHLTTAEKDELAKEVRESWHDPRHKPSDTFHRDLHLDSIDGMTAPDRILGASIETDMQMSPAYELLDGLEGHGGNAAKLSLAQTRHRLWNTVIAKNHDTPEAIAGSVGESQARKHKTAIGGQIAAVCRRYEYGEDNPGEADALFAPFGDLSEKERGQVVKALLSDPKRANGIWQSALDYANRRNLTPIVAK